jgi:hypothetical protein
MAGIRGLSASTILRAKTTSPVEPTAIDLTLADAGVDAVEILTLAVVTAAVATATVAVQVSLPFKLNHSPVWLDRQLRLSNITSTRLETIPSGDGTKLLLKTQVNKNQTKKELVVPTQERFFL